MTIVMIELDDDRYYICREPDLTWGLRHMRISKGTSRQKPPANPQGGVTPHSRARNFRAGVDALTEAAGMTHGSLYSQFGSKERLVEEALEYALAASAQATDGAATLADYTSNYLSTSHRDAPGRGCPLAALCCEMPRQSSGVRSNSQRD